MNFKRSIKYKLFAIVILSIILLGFSNNSLSGRTNTLGDNAVAATISKHSVLSVSVSSTLITCSNTTSTASADVSGGSPPYLYNWSSGGTAETEHNLLAGTYTLTITDATNCTATEIFNVEEDINIPTSTCAPPNDLNCLNTIVTLDGSASSSGPAINYFWFTIDGNIVSGQGTPIALVDQAGTYSLVVTNNNNACSSQSTVEVIEIAAPTLTAISTNVSCNGGNDGSIDITVSDGLSPFNFDWNVDALDGIEDPTGLSAGQYCVTVTDDIGCTSSTCEDIVEPLAISIAGTATTVCPGACDGSISIIVTGGTGLYTFEWNTVPTQHIQNIGNLCAGTYTVIVTDDNNCSAQATFTIIENDNIIIGYNVSEPLCHDGCDGSIMPFISGGSPPYTFQWSNGQTACDIQDICAGVYFLTITDDLACTETATIDVGDPFEIMISSVFTNSSCSGSCDGSIDITVEGGTGAFSYEWSNNQITEDLSGLCQGTYTVTVADENNCTATHTVITSEPSGLTIIPNIQDASCNGLCDGAVDIEVTGGTPPYTFEWGNGSTDEDPVNLCAGINTLIVTDANACSSSISIIIEEPDAITASLSANDVSCNGDCDGNIAMVVTGGTGPYTFLWTDNSTACDLPDACAGTYSVTITDANGCTLVESAIVNEPTAIFLIGTSTDPSCSGDCNGSIFTSTSGGVSPYSYQWSNGETTENIQNLCAGTYTVTVTDSNGCFTQSSFIIIDPPLLPPPIITGNLDLCEGISTILDAGAGYDTYQWSDGSTNQTIAVVLSGEYCVTVSDISTCTASNCVTVTVHSVDLQVSSTAETSNGTNDGTATATVTSGIAPFSYQWSNSENTATIENLAPGTYCVTVIDANGCSAEDCLIVESAACDLEGAISSVNTNCHNSSDGSATINIMGGVEPYNYNWSTGSEEMMITGLSAGTYTVTVIDANNCTIVLETIITEPLELIATASISPVSCNGLCDGAVDLVVTGGIAPYTYVWSGPCVGPNPTDVCAGTFAVTITDANGCTLVYSVSISEPPPIVPIVICTDETAPGANDGTCTESTTGGTPGYTEVWSNGESGPTITDLAPGIYCVTITDSNGCTASSCGTVDDSSCDLFVSISGNDLTCFGSGDGTATVAATGGIEPYTYLWSTGSEEMMITGLDAGNYSVTITDAENCTEIVEISIEEPPAIIITASSISPTCNGLCDGAVNLNVIGGNGPYEYEWSGPCEGPNPVDVCAGTFTVTVTDANGCTGSTTVTVSEPSAIGLDLTSIEETSESASDGTATATHSGGTAPFTYLWDDPNNQTTQTATGLSTGTYCVTVTDNNGCTETGCVLVGIAGCDLTLEVSSPNFTCFNTCEGTIDLTVNNGTPPFSFAWSDNTIGDIEDPDGLCFGDYSVTVTDSNQCTAVIATAVGQGPELVGLLTYYASTCSAVCTDRIDATITGGIAPYTYLWSNGAETEDIEDLCEGNYTLTVTDDIGCTIVLEPTLFIIENPLIAVIESTNTNCFGDCDGILSITVEGGTEPYDYDWEIDDYDGQSTIENLCAGIYTVTITDANGCFIIVAGEVNQADEMQLSFATNNACFNECDGTVEIAVSGGTPPYTYQWTGDPQMLCPGVYGFTITDANACTNVSEFTIAENPEITYVVDAINHDINMQGIGSIDITVNGGTPPFSYAWEEELDITFDSNEEDPSGLESGTYSCEVIDANGCIILIEGIVIDNIVATYESTWEDQINVFPNPLNDLLYIDYDLNDSNPINLEVFDIRGIRVLAKKSNGNNVEKDQLDLSHLANGLYTLRISSKEHFVTFKIVKME